jgi:arylformamidase
MNQQSNGLRLPTLIVIFLAAIQMTLSADERPAGLTYAYVSYGPHARNVLDFWQSNGDGPRPLIVFIHGGGWTQGSKSQAPHRYRPFLEKGISCAAINYRLSSDAPLPAPVHDAARAVQFLRFKAKEWNIDKARVALTGGSAGGCTSMWILLHDDLADPNSEDPVERESTRVSAAAVGNAQASLDPKVIEKWLGPNVLRHRMIWTSVGERNLADALANYEKNKATYVEFSPYNHLTKDDPPLLMTYTEHHPMTLPSKDANHGIHHPVFGVKVNEKADRLGCEVHLIIAGEDALSSDKYADINAFLIETLLPR